jgi:hypothetical protein
MNRHGRTLDPTWQASATKVAPLLPLTAASLRAAALAWAASIALIALVVSALAMISG